MDSEKEKKWGLVSKRNIFHPDSQCVSLDSASLIMYPEVKATEATFRALKVFASVDFISG